LADLAITTTTTTTTTTIKITTITIQKQENTQIIRMYKMLQFRDQLLSVQLSNSDLPKISICAINACMRWSILGNFAKSAKKPSRDDIAEVQSKVLF